MAATTFNASNRSGRMLAPAVARDAFLPNLRGIFDALTGERSSHAAMEAERQRHSQREGGQGSQAAQHPSFGPLDPNIISESIAAFFISRNADGFWLARERFGRIGGVFVLKRSAVSFAHRHAGDAACAMIFPEGRFELDIVNNGNRLVGLIGPVMRGVARLCRRGSKRMQAGQAA
jgi:hypothetical protein